MFDFIFKKRSVATTPIARPALHVEPSTHNAKDLKKQAELQQAGSFDGQEDAALNFILNSNFADARLLALRHIHGPDALRQIGQALRNTDRRVSKLAQEKLAELDNRAKMNSAAEACLLKGQALLQGSALLANQVTLWEKERLSLGDFGAALLSTRLELEHRLQEQVSLQREVMQLIVQLRSVPEEMAGYENQWQQIRSHALVESLPGALLAQLDAELIRAQAQARDVNLREKELSAIEQEQEQVQDQDLLIPKPGINLTADVKIKRRAEPVSEPVQIDVAAVLQLMESALEEGALQQALDLDKSVRLSNSIMSKQQSQRLNVIRAELNRLLDWAKWGGNVSRQELINVADGLLQGEHAPTELAKQVGGLRARWKELDRTSGGADQLLWGRFDAACTRAYAIADSYFKQQTQLRLENLQLARQTLVAMETELAGTAEQSVDLTLRQTYIGEVKNTWRKIGPIDRKFKSTLEQEFERKLAALNQPLQAAQELAVQARLQLIQSVQAISAEDREAVAKVKEAQQRWQQQSSAVVLVRKADQDLWRQFRAACDAIFARRQANAEQHQHERVQMTMARQACCERLEALADQPASEISAAIHSARLEWRNFPGQNRDLDARFNAAINTLVRRQDALTRVGRQSDLSALQNKMELCRKVEAACRSERSGDADQPDADGANWQQQWDELARLSSLNVAGPLNKLMTQRFRSALELFTNRGVVDAKVNAEQGAQWQVHALRIEISRNLPSPQELLQQRLQLQVRQLQQAMKNRSVSENYLTDFYALCSLPVALSEQDNQRLQTIMGDCLDSGVVS